MQTDHIINGAEIYLFLDKGKKHANDSAYIHELINKAVQLQGLNLEEVATLVNVNAKDLLQEIFHAALKVKEKIYGKRLVIFAPLYISNICSNQCLYCAFCAKNNYLKRRSLNQKEIQAETELLINQGQKRILLVAGEDSREGSLDYIIDSIHTVYATKNSNGGEIRRVNVNIAPLQVEEFKRLKNANIGTYQVFQETYNKDTYKKVHQAGKKADYGYRLNAPSRAMEAGIDDIGIGVLFGLHNWQFEILALMQHIRFLTQTFSVGPHTISVPRLEPAIGSDLASNPYAKVSDADFYKIVAILRLAVPYTGIILSTRENAELRRMAFELGVSQISAGSRTNPGGYSEKEKTLSQQFSLGDERSLDEVVYDIAKLGYIPSFCTSCYRLGRVGESFMKLAKNGNIKNMCSPNALLTFKEYLLDYASYETKQVGESLLKKEILKLSRPERDLLEKLFVKLEQGKRDVFV